MTITRTARSSDTFVGHDDVVEVLDLRMRDLVRREGVDPQRDADVVRRIAESVVREHDERSLTGMVAPVADVGALVDELMARVSGFGALQSLLDDPTVEEVWINDPSRVFVARNGRHELTNLVLTSEQVMELVERMLKSSGRRLDVSTPFVDATLPEGHRLHVVLNGISRGFTAVNTAYPFATAARLVFRAGASRGCRGSSPPEEHGIRGSSCGGRPRWSWVVRARPNGPRPKPRAARGGSHGGVT